MQLYALIVAGGSGKRMQNTFVPKQFLELAGKPVLMHTIERFKAFNDSIEIIAVLPENQIEYLATIQKKHSFSIKHTIVIGGATRFHSVKNGLNFVSEPSLVAIHDGVRPFVSADTIKRCFETAEKLGNAVPAVAITESLRIITDNDNSPIDRQLIRAIQTPQVFNASLIKKAYRQEYRSEFTDDATVFETLGEKINLVEGNRENIKITNPEDLLISNALFNQINSVNF
jgi:2-C-methyl-D-erythritol 4-phosphate cytidylyltransferase